MQSDTSSTVQWVSPQWISERLTSKEFIVLDTQPDVHDYILEHVPGAIYMNEKLWRCPFQGLPACYVPTESIQLVLRRLGITSAIPVVIYSGHGRFSKGGDGLEQTMQAYSLARFGLKNILIMDGGLDRWIHEGHPLTKNFPSITESDFTCSVQQDFYVDYDAFISMRERNDVQIFDVRPPSVYEGKGIWSKPGHIPGAVNLPWIEFMDRHNPNQLKPLNHISEYVTSRGADPKKTIVVYCGTGREATNAFTVFKWVLQYPNVKLFEGSFTQWCSHQENPTVTGKHP